MEDWYIAKAIPTQKNINYVYLSSGIWTHYLIFWTVENIVRLLDHLSSVVSSS